MPDPEPTMADWIESTIGITYEDLGLESDQDFEDLIDLYLTAVFEWVNTKLGTEYVETNGNGDSVAPEGLKQIIMDIVKRIISNDTIRQDLPTIDSDSYKVFTLIDAVITEDIENRLKVYYPKLNTNSIGMFTINHDTYDDDDDDDYQFVDEDGEDFDPFQDV